MHLNAVILLGSLFTPSAQATTGLAWQWGDNVSRQYLAKGTVILPQSLPLELEIPNLPAMPIGRFDSSILMTCTQAETAGKKAIILKCKVDDYDLQVLPFRQEHIPNVEKIVAPIAAAMSGSTIEARFTYDGKLSKVEVIGLDKETKWMADNVPVVELIVQRTVSLLDLQLPRDGDDQGKGKWKQSESLIMRLPIQNSGGSASIHHELKAVEASATVSSKGHAVIGDAMNNLMFGCDLVCDASFDPATGQLTKRECNLQGKATSNSIGGQAGHTYEHLGMLELTGGNTD